MFVEAMVDQAAEAQRIEKLRSDLQRQIAALRGRLANEAYLAKRRLILSSKLAINSRRLRPMWRRSKINEWPGPKPSAVTSFIQ